MISLLRPDLSLLRRTFFRSPLLAGLLILGISTASAGTLFTYTATVVTDARLGSRFFHNAAVTISFTGDAATVTEVPGFSDQPATFYWLPHGTASLDIEFRGRHVHARFMPDQLFVSVDTLNLGMGIGSYIGPNGLEPGYPLVFDRGSAGSLSGDSSVLSTASNSTGNAWSCVGFPPIDEQTGAPGTCAPADPYPLRTDRGDFFIYMPYTVPPPFSSARSASLNRGTFSITPAVPPRRDP
jgi:hypothetical protein